MGSMTRAIRGARRASLLLTISLRAASATARREQRVDRRLERERSRMMTGYIERPEERTAGLTTHRYDRATALRENPLRDRHQLHVRRALVDLADLRVAIELLDGIFLYEAVAAIQVDRHRRNAFGDFR